MLEGGGHLDEGAVCLEGVEVVVENRFADDIQGELGEAGLHVDRLPALCVCLPGAMGVSPYLSSQSFWQFFLFMVQLGLDNV